MGLRMCIYGCGDNFIAVIEAALLARPATQIRSRRVFSAFLLPVVASRFRALRPVGQADILSVRFASQRSFVMFTLWFVMLWRIKVFGITFDLIRVQRGNARVEFLRKSLADSKKRFILRPNNEVINLLKKIAYRKNLLCTNKKG